MKINRLVLNNFQGIKAAEFDFNGNSASIYGDNATGKTTVFNAITWLLFGNPSTGAKNYTPKTKGKDGDLHHLEHTAEAEFELDDGRIFTLKKVFHENYKKKRGSSAEEFDGHSIDFYLDGVPTKEKEYTSTLDNLLGGAEHMKMLTMLDYFAETMNWDERRKTLIEACGDINDSDIINSNIELTELNTLLLKPGSKTDQRYTVEEYRKIVTERRKDINNKISAIPDRIDEASRAIKEARSETELNRLLGEVEQKIKAKSVEISTGGTDTALVELNRQKAEMSAEIAIARTKHLEQLVQENKAIRDKISAEQTREGALSGEIERIKGRIEASKSDAINTKQKRERLLGEYEQIRSQVWDASSEVCPTCGRELPTEKVEEMKAAFNRARSEKLQMINTRGKHEASAAMIEEAEKRVVDYTAELDSKIKELGDVRTSISDLSSTINNTPFDSTPQYTEMQTKMAEIDVEINKATTDKAYSADVLKASQSALNEERAALIAEIAQVAQNKAQEKRIAELEAEEKSFGAEFEEAERGIYLCELFVRTKVGMITESINAKFKNVRFRLFVEQQNGGVREDCEVMIPSEGGRLVPYTFANNAARINAGLEIIDALSTHWGTTMPVVVDNAESVTKLNTINAQVIRLVVSEADKTLRMNLIGE